MRLTHLTLKCKSRTRTQPPYHTTSLTQPDGAPNPQDATDAAPNPQNAPDAAPNLQDATWRWTYSSGYSPFSTDLPEISELEGYHLYFPDQGHNRFHALSILNILLLVFYCSNIQDWSWYSYATPQAALLGTRPLPGTQHLFGTL